MIFTIMHVEKAKGTDKMENQLRHLAPFLQKETREAINASMKPEFEKGT